MKYVIYTCYLEKNTSYIVAAEVIQLLNLSTHRDNDSYLFLVGRSLSSTLKYLRIIEFTLRYQIYSTFKYTQGCDTLIDLKKKGTLHFQNPIYC